jgi:hypothetical protein
MVLQINLVLAFQTFVLITALFLLIYINKNQLGKWYRGGAIAVIIFIICLMICTTVNSCRMSCNHGMEMQGVCPDPGRMKEMFMRKGSCETERGGAMDQREGCCEDAKSKGCCEDVKSEGKAKSKGMCEMDSTVKKEAPVRMK